MLGVTGRMRLPRWAVVAGVLNLCLWIPALLSELPVADDPMFRESRPPVEQVSTSGMVFDLSRCADCPEYVLLGREVASGVSLLAYGLAALNFAPALLARGRDIGFGIRQLSPWVFFPGVLAQWAVVGVVATTISDRRKGRRTTRCS